MYLDFQAYQFGQYENKKMVKQTVSVQTYSIKGAGKNLCLCLWVSFQRGYFPKTTPRVLLIHHAIYTLDVKTRFVT